MQSSIARVWSTLDRNLGRCPRCMKTAFLCAVLSSPLFLVGRLARLDGWMALILSVPIGLTALWLAHFVTYGARVLRKLRAEYASTPFESAATSRRDFLWLLGTTMGLTVFATVGLPDVAFALRYCGFVNGKDLYCPDETPNCCRSREACCPPDTGWACYIGEELAKRACKPLWAAGCAALRNTRRRRLTVAVPYMRA